MDTRVVWLRRDLRLSDSPALAAALEPDADDLRVVPLFVLDPRLTGADTMSPARLAYLCDALADLDRGLHERGARLVVRRGDAREVVPQVAREVRATCVVHASDVTPFAAARDRAVAEALDADGVEVLVTGGVMIREPGTVVTEAGVPSRVYTPFRRRWESLPLDEPLPAPGAIPVHGNVRGEPLPTVAELGVAGRVPSGIVEGGETAAGDRLEAFLRGPAKDYSEGRDLLGRPGTSRLSADLHYGCTSPRATYLRLDRRQEGHASFAQELVWRDFYGHVMATWPQTRHEAFDPRYRAMPWTRGGPEYEAWEHGRTGYPIVDAGMRQLLAEGWVHNRARMVVASFLCKDLLVDWRLGEAHFLRHLVDADVASNNGGWQWAAGTGTDAQPFFRIFNPVTQGERFDPDGEYVRRYVPELSGVPAKWIHAPWQMPTDVAREAGVQIGVDYPEPIVDHQEARRRALDFLAEHKLA